MANLHIEFEWWRDRSGYRIEPMKLGGQIAYHVPKHGLSPTLPVLPGQWGLAYVPIGIRVLHGPSGESERPLYVRRGGGTLDAYRPLEAFESLFSRFAELRSPEDVLSFVERFGPLTGDGLDPNKGELVDGVLAHSSCMRDVFLFLAGDRAAAARILRGSPNPFAELVVMFGPDPGNRDLRLRLCPTSLLDALWLQAAQHLSSGATVRQCEHCSEWFEVGRGTGRRLDARFCSNRHRIDANSLKRSQGRRPS